MDSDDRERVMTIMHDALVELGHLAEDIHREGAIYPHVTKKEVLMMIASAYSIKNILSLALAEVESIEERKNNGNS